jgi:hypothetical protein
MCARRIATAQLISLFVPGLDLSSGLRQLDRRQGERISFEVRLNCCLPWQQFFSTSNLLVRVLSVRADHAAFARRLRQTLVSRCNSDSGIEDLV